METIKTITLDINKKSYDSIVAKQNDEKSRYILFNLIDNGMSLNLTNHTVKFYAKKPDGTEIYNNGTIISAANGQVKIELTTQALALVGTLKCELVIYGADLSKLSTVNFLITVLQSINSDDAVVSTNEFTVLTEALSVVTGIENKAEKTYVDENFTEIRADLAERVKGKDVVTNAQTDGINTTFGHESNIIANDISTSVILGGGSTGYNNVIGGDGANVNTTTPNTTTTGTGAHVSVVGGYDNSAGSLSSKIIADHSKTEVGGAGHNAIYGGANHIARSTAKFSMIAGGQQNEVSNQYTFATGYLNIVSGQSGFACGDHNTVSGNFSKASGTTNTVSGIGAEAHGSTNTAAGNFGSARGNYAYSRFVGQHAFTGGKFANTGDAQSSDMEMHRATTDATTVTLGVLGSSTSYQLQLNQSVAFKSLLVARDTAGTDTAAWEIKGMARRGASGNTVPVGVVITSIGADAGTSAWTVAVTGDSAGGLNVRITGEAGKTIRWVMRMSLVEVMI